ncbi:MAG: O-antigen ligase family protein [Solirubrobacterales bacterium]
MGAAAAIALAIYAGMPESDGVRLSPVVFALPALAASIALALRRPLISMTLVFGLMGFSGTLAVNTPVPVRAAVWLLLVGLMASVAISYLVSIRSQRVAVWPGFIALGAYVLYTAALIPFAETPQIGARAFLAGPAFIVVFLVIAYARWGRSTRRRMVEAFILVAALAGAYTLFRLFVGPTAAEESIARRSAQVGGELALFGSLPNRVELGGFSAISAPVLFALALGLRGRWRLLSAAAFALMVVGLIGSQVRIALVAAVAGIVLVLLLFQLSRAFPTARSASIIMAVAGLLIAGSLGYALTIADSPTKVERFERILHPGSDYSFQQRVRKWSAAVDEINREPLGQGLGTAGMTERRYSQVLRLDNFYIDNSYLQLGIQFGYPGLILLGTGAVLMLWSLIRSSVLSSDRQLAALGIAASGALLTWLVDLLGGSNYESWGALLLWLFLGLVAGAFVSSASLPQPLAPARRSDSSSRSSRRRGALPR